MNRWLILSGFLLATLTVGAIGGIATASSVTTWYPTLIKPSWNPPSWVFGPVWTTLYVMIAFVGWRIWKLRPDPVATTTMRLFWIQLLLNAAWSPAFFALQRPGLALVDLTFLWLALVWIQIRLARSDLVSALLWLPYLFWVTFAGFLNLAIWRLNA